ncbi:uncharacterized protein MYCFIDRAFT_82104 [Pseudocercospora fijiensis CIRAD86]|uniref:Extracellular membrane protein CFEM domain-containing protein n=1 Tax=Pseudocercospora fijiensis (strain CIRAD86) TaxID=383855 RepID=M3BA25_PSEFD|nr:uncharacterized protein MYCFIDRAFT_82104 [Pseudocercospora fijiensis CIRAD86]EME86177.1 hypothetical protein MYCFIDRAFT_82104 [Pseudocercospora fijiensis CIRAD86]
MPSFWSKVALLALPATTLAVSLSDFTPRVSNLPTRCEAVYTQTVHGCSSTDWEKDGCSEACVEGLQEIAADVKSACENEDITGQNIIVAYLAGSGPSSLCPNAAAILGGGSSSNSDTDSSTSTPSTRPGASSALSTPSSTSSTPKSTKPSATSTAASETETVSSVTTAPAASSSTGLLLDTSSTPTSGSVSSTSSASGSSQTDNGQSGGGSPFDTPSNSAALPSSPLTAIVAAALMLSMLVR